MKRKYLLSFFIITVLTLLLSTTALAAETTLYDRDDLLSAAEKTQVEAAIAEARAQGGISYAVLILDGSNVKNSLHERMKEEDSVVLLITKEAGVFYYEMFTYGRADRLLSDRRFDKILDDPSVYDTIKGGDLAEGILSFLSLTSDALLSAEEAGDGPSLGSVILVSALLAAAVAGGGVGAVVYRYKKKLKAPIYPLERFAALKLADRSDTYITSHVTRTRIASDHSDGSRSHSGGGGGGSRGRR